MNMGTNVDSTRIAPRVRGPHVHLLSGKGMAYLALRSGWRYFVTGDPIIHGRQDNATFLHDATSYYGDHPRPRLTRAKWRRLARRWAALGIPGSLLSMEGAARLVDAIPFMDAPDWTHLPYAETAAGYAIVMPAALGAIYYPQIRTAWALREVRREVIYPATRVACQILGEKWDRRKAQTMLELPAGFGEPTEDEEQPEVRLYLPPVPLDPNTKKRIITNVGARLGLPDAVGEWQEFGGRAWVKLQGADVPPKSVDLSAAYKLEDGEHVKLREAIENADMDRPVVGVASGGRIIRLDYKDDSPNVALSGGTGTGKSTLIRAIAVQRLRGGAGRVILDLKGISHPYAHRLPASRALYFYKIEDIHDACVAIGAELYRRRDEGVAAQKAGRPLPTFRPVDVDVEEANSLIVELNAYWTNRRKEIIRENKEALEGDEYADVTEPPVRSPAVDALGFLVQMGRELCMFPHYAGQRLSAAAFGGQGGDRRESFQQRGLAKWTRATWRMLCPDVPYRVCPSGPRGMWAIVRGAQVDMIRVPFLSVDMAVSMILDSPDPGTPVLPEIGGVRVQVSAPTIPGEVVQGVRPDRLVSLADAAGVLPLSKEALRSARKQDPRFPDPAEIGGPGRADLFGLASLVSWWETREGRPLELG